MCPQVSLQLKNSAMANLELLTVERNQDVRGKAEGERACFSTKMHIGCDPAHLCVCVCVCVCMCVCVCVCVRALLWGLWNKAAPCVSRKLHERTCNDV